MDQWKTIKFLVYWIVNVVGLIAASFVFKNNIVLGNEKTASSLAVVICALIITTVGYVVPMLIKKHGLFVKNEKAWGAVYLVCNIVVVWILKYLALFLGLGISSILFTFILGIWLTGIQWTTASALGETKRKM